MAPPGSHSHSLFSLPSGSHIINLNYRFCHNSFFFFLFPPSLRRLLFYLIGTAMVQPQFHSIFFPLMEYNPSVKEASTNVIVAKTVIIINHLAAMAKSGSLWNCNSILRQSSSKNEGDRVRLCQNSVAFTLPTTVAPVERTLATTVALGSFSSCFNTSLSLNGNIFIRLCCRALLRTCKPAR